MRVSTKQINGNMLRSFIKLRFNFNIPNFRNLDVCQFKSQKVY